MILVTKIFPNDTQWAVAGKTTAATLERLARALPKDLQGEGSKVVMGKDGFAALLVFGDLPSESLAKRLLSTVTPVYLLDFDDDAPSTLELERKKGRIVETRLDKHPADLLEEQDIIAPGYASTPTSVKDVALVEGVTINQARRVIADKFGAELAAGLEAELREHPRGVLMLNGPVGATIGRKVGRRSYSLYHNPEDGWFSCVVQEPGKNRSAFCLGEPDANAVPLDNILGETTLEGILRVLEIPGELLGLRA
jgi:hypothetical protein